MKAVCAHIGTNSDGKLHLVVRIPSKTKLIYFLFDPTNHFIAECDNAGKLLGGKKFTQITANLLIVRHNKDKKPVSAPEMIYLHDGRCLKAFEREY